MKKPLLRKTNRHLRRLYRSRRRSSRLLAVGGLGQVPVPVPEAVHDGQSSEPGSLRTPAPGKGKAVSPEERKTGDAQHRRGRRRKRAKWDLTSFQVEAVSGKSRFHDFDLPLALMRAVADLGFQYCTPIQAKALPDALSGKDLVGRASTGTGKSAVFLLALFARLLREQRPKARPGFPRALILAPTRELVQQIAKDGRRLSKYTSLRIVPVYGGTDYQKQIEQLKRGPVDVVVATPGRLLDYITKKVVNLNQIETLIIDEADRMLDMGFIPDVRRIIHWMTDKKQRQTMLFSATVTPEVKQLASQWCVSPEFMETEPEQVAVETVEQVVYMTTIAEKYAVLYNTITATEHERIIVFTNMKSEARKLYERLRGHSINCTLLTGDVPQQKRMARLERFREGKVDVLIATDVAGRGIHIDGISHVINYTLPYEPEDYVHRIGRTGRAGNAGVSISFADEEGAFYLPEIEEYIGQTLPCLQPEESLLAAPPPVRESKRASRRKPRGKRKWR